MKTLTEMLDKILNDTPPESQAEKEANYCEIKCIKDTFKEWLKSVGLTDYYQEGLHDVTFNATQSIRDLLIILVDEP